MIPTKFINEIKYGAKAMLDKVFTSRKEKGMPFIATDGKVYHMQARDKDRTNVTGLYLGARDFMIDGDLVPFTPYEDINSVSIERSQFINVIVPQYLQYFSALHFTRKLLESQLSTGVEITDIKTAFEQTLQTILKG